MSCLGPQNIGKIYGAVCLRRQRRKRQKVLIVELLHDYAQNSTLHGLRYIVERGLNLFDKIFWLLTFLLSIGMCFHLMSNVWIKWRTSPVIVTVNEKYIAVGDVPFPSITICPQLKCKASVFNFSKELFKMKEIENLIRENNDSVKISDEDRVKMEIKLEDLGSVCGININWELLIDVRRNITNSSLIENLFEVAPRVKDAFFYCQWQGKSVQCEDLFQSVITREGICYNFNSLAADEILRHKNLQRDYAYLNTTTPSEDWSISEGYTDFRIGKTYPKRGVANNISPDLKVVLRESPQDRDGWCNVVKSGYTIFIQHPADLPQSSRHYYAALPGQISSLAVKFSMLTADDALKGYDPEVRQCFFPGDRTLRYFRIYTISNCMLECQSNYTFKKCNCVGFHMPHNDSRQICINVHSNRCIKNALESLAQTELNVKSKVKNEDPCRCLPPCNSILYDAEILRSAYNVHTYLENRRKQYEDDDPKVEAFFDALQSLNFSEMDVYFKHSHFISMRRSELFGVTEFMANCGGLLGLFLGFSFLSLVEIFYFATISGVFGGDIVTPTKTTVAVITTAEQVVKTYGDVCLRKSRRKRQKLLMLELLYEYAKNTTLHGLGYIVEKGLHYVERVFWFVTFFLSLAMCFLLIRNVWAKWITSPVIVSFSEKFVSVGDVPFPSITICPEQKVNTSVFNFSHYDHMFAEYERKRSNLQNKYEYSNHITPQKDWSPKGGYTDLTNETYPRRGMENQGNPDLDIIITESVTTNDSLCNVLRNGFTIYVQHPRDHPQATLYYYAAIPDQVSSLALKFNRLSTANSLIDYTAEARQCYFPEDRKLRYFNIYTSNNCRLECQSNYTYQKCGCVWFHMPHNDSNEICGVESLYCVEKALKELSTAEIKNDMSDDIPKCQCLPLCDAVQYDAEILKTNFRVQDYFRYLETKRHFHFNADDKSKKYSKIEVYFKEPRFISMCRSELFGVTDFLANCGGLLGLFLGFSFLSLVEIGYFSTLRLYFRLKKDSRQQKKQIQAEQKEQ
ncbi:hypothetical protein O0L34_g4636 [Tuta absoluta]|nr:hypothetical protein O0L34_g4636 [Tuta absoluta]